VVWGLELDKQALIEISLNFAYLTIDYRFVVRHRFVIDISFVHEQFLDFAIQIPIWKATFEVVTQ